MSARLDAELAARGLARSRSHASQLIAAGLVSIDGRAVVKPSVQVDESSTIEVAGADHYVSRGAHKLLAALDDFPLEVEGRVALDLGASTGGFTQVLRERGARPVLAVDVGHGQLSTVVASDPDVVSVEGYNVRFMTADSLAAATGIAERPRVVTGDLSFISLTHVLPAVIDTATPDADVVLLIKPQFEVGRTAVKGGLVTDPALRSDAVHGVLWAAWDVGLRTAGLIASPIVGTHGNQEYVAWFSAVHGSDPSEWESTVTRLTGSR
ncbi:MULTISPECIES: TlyA family RNA methyltransferase [Microbacterium]|uniref:TlyA family RNA methyltransferase n=1 Tax=Microbacterium TaxID=33882 RepID=UPI0027870208|nr:MULTISPECIES: TlyA family RNA methyltransferase [Microbacterium]MDQ1085191.1 23S rRNA (cytidine1920-2'-O)/16S rRNA (cytidine1409-2'-O)-methyltransferase [Microbacterium sp. SORGH_AS_0344]MDQ1169503.1 23S rRNA (cytidine1920-2'-O)/16S rRNA (cytidine1409-2'-O)-methyltransferase [Microbacterium proteolyticum]